MAYYSRVRHFNRFIMFSLAPPSRYGGLRLSDINRHKMPADVQFVGAVVRWSPQIQINN